MNNYASVFEDSPTKCYKLQKSFKYPSKIYKVKNKEYLCIAIAKRRVRGVIATKER